VLPKAGPLFVASFRLIPAGTLLIAFARWSFSKPSLYSSICLLHVAATSSAISSQYQNHWPTQEFDTNCYNG
jgi:hypothetical protein